MKYQWDYPTQGLRHPRTLQEAFGPYARMDSQNSRHTKSVILYAVAATLALAAVIIAITN